ncbi:MAG: flagellar hook-basal body complex protein [Limnohabitans sp.]
MDRLAFNAAAAITEQRLGRQSVINELANVSTTGFKRSYESATQAIKVTGAGLASRYQPQSVSKDIIDLRPGTLMATGRPMDVAMNASAVLGVTGSDGELAFTRRGDLRVSANGVLETGAGQAVRGADGGVITIPPGFEASINSDGNNFARAPGQATNAPGIAVGRLLLRDASQVNLTRRTDGLFGLQDKPGQDIPVAGNATLPSVTPQALEGSNVSAMAVMVKLMEQSRSFEQQIKVIKESRAGDESGSSMLKVS